MPEEGQAVERTLASETLAFEGEEFRVVGNVVLRGRLQPVEDSVFRLTGKLVAPIEVICGRCVEPYRMEVSEDFDLLYLPQWQNTAPEIAKAGGDVSESGEMDRGLAAG